MAKQTFTTGQVLTAAQMTSLQQTAMGGGSATAKTVSYTLLAADAGTTVIMNSASSTTVTVNTALFAAGDTVLIVNQGAGVCTVTAGTATVSTAGSLALAQYETGVLYFLSTGAAIFSDYTQTSASTSGMTLISTASYTTASSVSLATDSFTSTYDNYKLIINISTFAGTNTYLTARLRAAGTDNSTSNYTSQFCLFSQTASTITNDSGGAASSAFARLGYVYSAAPQYIAIDIFNPKTTAKTTYAGTVGAATTEGWINSGLFNATTSFDSFTFYPTAGTVTGTYSLYGYNK